MVEYDSFKYEVDFGSRLLRSFKYVIILFGSKIVYSEIDKVFVKVNVLK